MLKQIAAASSIVACTVASTVVAIVLGMSTAHADIVSATVDCASIGNGYAECATGLATISQSTLVSEDVAGSCVYGSTWGTYNALVWVNHGCSGRFKADNLTSNPVPTPVPVPPPAEKRPAYQVVDCRWNSVNWQPFYKPDGHFIGRAGFGFVDTNTCVLTVQMATKRAVCNWTGNGFTPYDIESNIELVYVSYQSLQMCYDQIR